MTGRKGDITLALEAICNGDEGADRHLLALVYGELRRAAGRLVAREPAGQSLQPTDLVHEVYLRLFREAHPTWENRAHFFGAAGTAMRRILVERARRRRGPRRGGGQRRVTLDERVV